MDTTRIEWTRDEKKLLNKLLPRLNLAFSPFGIMTTEQVDELEESLDHNMNWKFDKDGEPVGECLLIERLFLRVLDASDSMVYDF